MTVGNDYSTVGMTIPLLFHPRTKKSEGPEAFATRFMVLQAVFRGPSSKPSSPDASFCDARRACRHEGRNNSFWTDSYVALLNFGSLLRAHLSAMS